MTTTKTSFHILSLSILGGMLLLGISVVLWGANRGLGFGDEGIYLLASRYPDEIQQNVSAIFAFTGHLFSLANYNPVTFRILGVVAIILSALVFWFGFHKLLEKLHPETIGVKFFKYYSLVFVVTGSILHYQWSCLTPSYYTLTALMPIAGSFGTSNPLFNVIQFYAVPWFAAIFLLLTLLTLRVKVSPALLIIVVLGISGYVSNHAAQGSAFKPAPIKPRNLFDQSIPTAVGNPSYILNLDTDTHNVTSQLSIAAKADGFKPGDDIIGFNEIAGLVYAVAGTPRLSLLPKRAFERIQ
jgi:hypothetical protein